MYKAMRLAMGVALAMAAASCGHREQAADAAHAGDHPDGNASGAASTVRDAMVRDIVPASNVVWELAGDLWNDEGNLDAARLDEDKWQRVREAAVVLRDSATSMAGASPLIAAPAGVKILNEDVAGAPGAAMVQAALDADPQTFRQRAGDLARVAGDIVTAAAARDAAKTDALSNEMTDVCGACHRRYWTGEERP